VLLLFDVDGTLVRGAAEAHAAALIEALSAVHRVRTAAVRVAQPAGRTDAEIARILLLDAGVSAERIDSLADDVRAASCEAYARLCPADLREFLVPGIVDLLSWLSGLEGVRLSLVTGNFEPIARLKLLRAGVGRWFPAGQGGFGSDAEDRAALPPLARRRAGSGGVAYARADTILIGDTPRDIACARADGVRCAAVTTGPYGPDELAAADWVADGPGQLRAIIEALQPGYRAGLEPPARRRSA
jgi:phosphoglycolate phosphatase-like HAD superfamily hydrolase